MQLMPATAAQYGVTNPFDPTQNVPAGVQYLAALLAKYGGNVAEAAAAYDWGPGNLDKAINANGDGWLAAAPAETQAYVAAIAGVTPADLAPDSSGGGSGGAGAAPVQVPDVTTYTIDPSTGYLVPDTSAADAADFADSVDVTGLSTGEILALTGLGVAAYFLLRE
jgi:hypothetical protein